MTQLDMHGSNRFQTTKNFLSPAKHALDPQSIPAHPTSHTQVPFPQTPWPEQFARQGAGLRNILQSEPPYPGSHKQAPKKQDP